MKLSKEEIYAIQRKVYIKRQNENRELRKKTEKLYLKDAKRVRSLLIKINKIDSYTKVDNIESIAHMICYKKHPEIYISSADYQYEDEVVLEIMKAYTLEELSKKLDIII
jgi:hypothetical protein